MLRIYFLLLLLTMLCCKAHEYIPTEIILHNTLKNSLHFFGSQFVPCSKSASIKVNNPKNKRGNVIELEVNNTQYILEYLKGKTKKQNIMHLDLATLLYMYHAPNNQNPLSYQLLTLLNDTNQSIVMCDRSTIPDTSLEPKQEYILKNLKQKKIPYSFFVLEKNMYIIPACSFNNTKQNLTLSAQTIIHQYNHINFYQKHEKYKFLCLIQ